mmetsp:Transcript_17288/g.34385  ORF Transcript_17288/g.34385 Transcript_17288/m.34385 type:complete len:108 (-) Transcript_17288:3-326(-)
MGRRGRRWIQSYAAIFRGSARIRGRRRGAGNGRWGRRRQSGEPRAGGGQGGAGRKRGGGTAERMSLVSGPKGRSLWSVGMREERETGSGNDETRNIRSRGMWITEIR